MGTMDEILPSRRVRGRWHIDGDGVLRSTWQPDVDPACLDARRRAGHRSSTGLSLRGGAGLTGRRHRFGPAIATAGAGKEHGVPTPVSATVEAILRPHAEAARTRFRVRRDAAAAVAAAGIG